MSTPYEQMKSGEIYWPSDTSLMEQQFDCLEKLYDFNATRPHEQGKRQALLKEMLAEVGKDCYIEPPLRANWGGHHLHLGNQVYANFNLTLVDDCDIYIGDHTMIGPNVTIATANHPLAPELRERAYQYNCRSTSARTSGSARASSSCPASRLATTRSSARAAS